MRYQGGKTRQWRHIVPIIQKYLTPDCWYVEPFLGGGNIFSHVKHHKKLGSDLDSELIAMWNFFKKNGHTAIPNPSTLTKEVYDKMKMERYFPEDRRVYPMWMHGFVSHICSYGGKKWGGYAKYNEKKGEDHIKEACSSMDKQLQEMFNGECNLFMNKSYDKLLIPKNSVIYCDPPYENSLGYGNSFDNNAFWDWCRTQTNSDNIVLVSEYSAPSDFKCLLRLKRADGMGTTKVGHKQKAKSENLYICTTK